MKRIDQRDDLRASTDLLAFIPRLTISGRITLIADS